MKETNFVSTISELKVGELRTPNIKRYELLMKFEDILPAIMFRSPPVEIAVGRKKLSVSLSPLPIELEEPPQKPFDLESTLQGLEADFNFVAALVLGRLGVIVTDTKVSGRCAFSRKEEKQVFVDQVFKIGATGLASWSSRANFNGVSLEADEDIAGLKSISVYRMLRNPETTTASVQFEGKFAGSISLVQLAKVLRERSGMIIATLSGERQ